MSLYLGHRKKVRARALKNQEASDAPEAAEEAAEGAAEEAAEEADVPVYSSGASMYNRDQKQGGEMVETEKPQDHGYSTPSDPHPPPQQYVHQYPASITSGDNVPVFTSAQPHNDSFQQYYSANVTNP